MTQTFCAEFAPQDDHHLTFCACTQHWKLHSERARSLFFVNASTDIIDMVVVELKKEGATHLPKCDGYFPSHDWIASKEPTPDCTCSRPRVHHTPGDVLKGIRAYRNVEKPLCAHFWGTLLAPGICAVCNHKWIKHLKKPHVIEAFEDQHKTWCKCVIMNGDLECSCMSYEEIQNKLDDIARLREPTKVDHCKQFKPITEGNALCICGAGFYIHTPASIDGAKNLYEWRASHMSNQQLAKWFMTLEGKTRAQRIVTLRKFLTDPHFSHRPLKDMVNPTLDVIEAMIDALDTASHLVERDVLVVVDKEEDDLLPPGDIYHEDDVQTSDKKFHCHSCGEVDSNHSGSLCPSCAGMLASSGSDAVTGGA